MKYYTYTSLKGKWVTSSDDKILKEKNVGFQHLDPIDQPKNEEEKELYNGILYKEVGGYCCMWSFFMMDLRLKFPKIDPTELMSIAYKNLNKGDSPFRTFIRSFTFNIMEDMNKQFEGTYDFLAKYSSQTQKGKNKMNKMNKVDLINKVEEFVNMRKDKMNENLKKKNKKENIKLKINPMFEED